MLKDRQEILVVGELVLFVAAWGLGLAAAVHDYRGRTNAQNGSIAANADFSQDASFAPDPMGSSYSRPSFLRQPGEFE